MQSLVMSLLSNSPGQLVLTWQRRHNHTLQGCRLPNDALFSKLIREAGNQEERPTVILLETARSQSQGKERQLNSCLP